MPQILLVEDDVEFRGMLVQMLQQDGHQVVTAGNGFEALHLLRTIKPDLILTDILMPEKDGIEVIMELTDMGSKIPIIAMSGGRRAVTSEFSLDSAAMLGVKITLAKPFQRSELRQAIALALA